MQELLHTLAEELVEDPEGVSVRERLNDGVVELEVTVAREDRGRVIGQRGRTADALRTVLGTVAARKGLKVSLEIK